MAAVPAPIPASEAERLAALRDYEVLDTPPEQAFDDLTALASFICGTPISVVSLIDQNRQWFKSVRGLDTSETSRDAAFCAHAILQDDVFIVGDATRDSRFAGNPLVTSDPSIRFYAGAPLRTAEGHALGTLCVIDRVPRELTDGQRAALEALSRQVMAQLDLRRHLREMHAGVVRLHELDRLKNDFVSMVSHELRTPLTSIRGGLQLVLSDAGTVPDGDARLLLERALSSSERLIRLTNDILDLSAMEAGRLDLRATRCEVARIVATACEAVSHMAQGEQRLRREIAADAGMFTVDGDRLVQALVNLIGNALKFSPASTPVTVSAARRGDRIELVVRDQGPGMSAEDLGRLFRPFQQLEHGRRAGGSGLGLVITKGIVEQHGGTLTVSSRVGSGTAFSLSLPAN